MDPSWFKDYQTLIVGAVGFAGVILTMLYNAKVARGQREDERSYEREALRVALVAELQINRRSFEENTQRLREDPPEQSGGALLQTGLMDGAYRSFLPKIGLLSEAEVGAVMNAYLTIEAFKASLFLIGVPNKRTPQHVLVAPEHLEWLARMQESLLEPINRAIEALETAKGAR